MAGRPTKYEDEYAKRAYKLCLMGATDEQLADFFEVSEATLNTWKKKHTKFLEALRKGKLVADSNVAHALYMRAVGFKKRAVKIFAHPATGAVVREDYDEYYPPDTGACNSWLNNRQKHLWKRNHSVEVTGPAGAALFDKPKMDDLSNQELAAIAQQLAASKVTE